MFVRFETFKKRLSLEKHFQNEVARSNGGLALKLIFINFNLQIENHTTELGDLKLTEDCIRLEPNHRIL